MTLYPHIFLKDALSSVSQASLDSVRCLHELMLFRVSQCYHWNDGYCFAMTLELEGIAATGLCLRMILGQWKFIIMLPATASCGKPQLQVSDIPLVPLTTTLAPQRYINWFRWNNPSLNHICTLRRVDCLFATPGHRIFHWILEIIHPWTGIWPGHLSPASDPNSRVPCKGSRVFPGVTKGALFQEGIHRNPEIPPQDRAPLDQQCHNGGLQGPCWFALTSPRFLEQERISVCSTKKYPSQ